MLSQEDSGLSPSHPEITPGHLVQADKDGLTQKQVGLAQKTKQLADTAGWDRAKNLAPVPKQLQKASL